MSSFEVKVRKITVSPHGNADALEVGAVDGYQFVVGKGNWQTGEMGVYIPEQSVVPDELIKEMELEGRLAGKEKNRVKAIKLRGVLSQGLFYKPKDKPLPPHWDEGTDVAEELGITKWEPPVPQELAGRVKPAPPLRPSAPFGFRTYTDIENIKKFPDVLIEGEEIVITEKLHGTCAIFGLVGDDFVVSSKGIAGRGMVLEDEPGNVYWRVAKKYGIRERLKEMQAVFGDVLLFGEGVGVQDLKYGVEKGDVEFRAFDIYTKDGFVDYGTFSFLCGHYDIPKVPLFYQGPYKPGIVEEWTNGPTYYNPELKQIREGVVVKTYYERHDPKLGRVILKSISESYLLRKGDTTEFN